MTSTIASHTPTTTFPTPYPRALDSSYDIAGAAWYDGQPRDAARYDGEHYPARRAAERAGTAASGPRVDQLRFWVGSGVTAAIAALAVAISGVVIGVLAHVPALTALAGVHIPVHTASYALVAVLLTLLAAGLYDAMLQVAPRPTLFWAWLVVLGTVLAAVLPFALGLTVASAVAFAAVNVVIGLVVLGLVPYAAENARRA